jgi:hypothetical protein
MGSQILRYLFNDELVSFLCIRLLFTQEELRCIIITLEIIMIRTLSLLTTAVVAIMGSEIHVETTKLWNTRPHHNKAKSRGFAYEKEIANEMFELVPGNIMTLEEKRQESTRTSAAVDTGTYEIVTVTPTAINNNDIITVSFFASDPNSQPYGDWYVSYL